MKHRSKERSLPLHPFFPNGVSARPKPSLASIHARLYRRLLELKTRPSNTSELELLLHQVSEALGSTRDWGGAILAVQLSWALRATRPYDWRLVNSLMWAYLQMGRPADAMEALSDHLQRPRPLPNDGMSMLLLAYLAARKQGGPAINFDAVKRRFRSHAALRGIPFDPRDPDQTYDEVLAAFSDAIREQDVAELEFSRRVQDTSTITELEAALGDVPQSELTRTPWIQRRRQSVVARHRRRMVLLRVGSP